MIVRIYQPSKSATQSGRAKTQSWVLEYEPVTRREPEPLMGWISSGDTNNQVRLTFDSKDQAIAFAEDKGWKYIITQPQVRIVRPRNYADNFRYIPSDYTDARKTVHTTKKPPHQTPVVDDIPR